MAIGQFHYNEDLGKILPCNAKIQCPYKYHFKTEGEGIAFIQEREMEFFTGRVLTEMHETSHEGGASQGGWGHSYSNQEGLRRNRREIEQLDRDLEQLRIERERLEEQEGQREEKRRAFMENSRKGEKELKDALRRHTVSQITPLISSAGAMTAGGVTSMLLSGPMAIVGVGLFAVGAVGGVVAGIRARQLTYKKMKLIEEEAIRSELERQGVYKITKESLSHASGRG